MTFRYISAEISLHDRIDGGNGCPDRAGARSFVLARTPSRISDEVERRKRARAGISDRKKATCA